MLFDKLFIKNSDIRFKKYLKKYDYYISIVYNNYYYWNY